MAKKDSKTQSAPGKLRCRIGDLAFMTSRGNLGKVVRVLERAEQCIDDYYGRPAWLVESLGSGIERLAIPTGRALEPGAKTNTPDALLIPMRGREKPKKATSTKMRKVVQHG